MEYTPAKCGTERQLPIATSRARLDPSLSGWVAEWSIAHAWKACVP